MSMKGFIKNIRREGGEPTMVNEYIGLITHLILFKRNHPEYAEKIYKVLKVMEVDKILINAIEEDLSAGDE